MSGSTPFGRYLLHGILGSGGMAVVYRASVEGPEGFRRDLVVKRMLPGFFTDPRNARMMAAEARVLSRLAHPCVVQLYEFGEVAGEYFLAMEYVDGVDLSTLLGQARARGGALAIDLVCYVGSQLASALAAVHELTDEQGRPLQVVHRDVTPSNVMASVRGEVKLLDFGIAQMAPQPGVEVDKTKTNFVKGKLTYVAPEQLTGARPDARSDLYSLGVLLYEAFSGRRLFAGANDLEVLAKRQQLLEVPRLSAIGVAVPSEVDALIATLLAAEPDERNVRAREAERALAAHAGADAAGRLATLVAEARSHTRAPAVPPTGELEAEPVELSLTRPERGLAASPVQAAGTPRRRRLLAGAAGLALAVVTAALVGRAQRSASAPAHAEAPHAATAEAAPPASDDVPEPSAAASRATSPSEPPSRDLVATNTPAPGAEPEPPAPMRLSIKGTPGARVELDGRLLGTVPLSVEVPSAPGKRATLRVSHAGFATVVRPVELERDAEVDVRLKKLGGGSKLPGTVKASEKPPRAPPPGDKKEFADPFR